MAPGTSFITCLWIINSLLFNSVSLLKLSFKTADLPLQSFNQRALSLIFVQLRETGQYTEILELLNLKTFDTSPAYVDTCESMTSEEYKNIIETCYSLGRKEDLSKLLSADCVVFMDKSVFHDSLYAHSLSDLPVSILSTERKAFNFRTRDMRHVFCKIVSKSLEILSNKINWNNIVISPPTFGRNQSNRISLKESLTSCADSIDYNTLFYYINPTMISSCDHPVDFKFLVENVIPDFSALPSVSHTKSQKFYNKNSFKSFNLQLFKTVTSINFFYELGNMLKTNNLSQIYRTSLQEAYELIFDNLRGFLGNLKILHAANSPCAPFNRLISIILALLQNFIPNLDVLQPLNRKISFNYLFKSILYLFNDHVSPKIQGDWLCNLFYLCFYKINSDWELSIDQQNPLILTVDSFLGGLQVFFNRNPTNTAIQSLNILFKQIRSYSFFQLARSSFEATIPSERITELVNSKIISFYDLPNRFNDIPFVDRFTLLLKESRKQLSLYSISYVYLDYIYLKSSNFAQTDKSQSICRLEAFHSALLTIYQNEYSIKPIHPYGTFKLFENDYIKTVSIRECIAHLFVLILKIPEFHIISGYSQSRRKPIIFLTPLLSRFVGNVLGQVFALSAILNIPVPFLIDPKQLRAIFSPHLDAKSLPELESFCKKSSIYLQLLQHERNVSSQPPVFSRQTNSYFGMFYKWSNLFFTNESGLEIDDFVLNAIGEFNSNFNFGFQQHFHHSQFNLNEILLILSK